MGYPLPAVRTNTVPSGAQTTTSSHSSSPAVEVLASSSSCSLSSLFHKHLPF